MACFVRGPDCSIAFRAFLRTRHRLHQRTVIYKSGAAVAGADVLLTKTAA